MKRRFAIQIIAFAVIANGPLAAQETSIFSEATPASSATVEPVTPQPTAAPTATPSPTPLPTPVTTPPQPPKRSWAGRLFHPFSGGKPKEPDFKNSKLRGLFVDLELSPQTVKLSEVRQLNVHVTLTNKGKRGVTLDFPNDQRIDIHLLNPAEVILTRWSDNHAIKDKPGTLLINPQEHVDYKETIATRDLSPDKVYTVEIFFPKYPELHARQKFLTAP